MSLVPQDFHPGQALYTLNHKAASSGDVLELELTR